MRDYTDTALSLAHYALSAEPNHCISPAVSSIGAAAWTVCAHRRALLQILERRRVMSMFAPVLRRLAGGYRVRELVCTYRPLRDAAGRRIRLPTVTFTDPRTTATTLAPLLAEEPVEVFAVACLSTRHQLLAWYQLSRGTRASAIISVPEVFVPAYLTPGATALVVMHNHPSDDPTPSADDARLTRRLSMAANLLDITLLDHLIVGHAGRYFSFREAGVLGGISTNGDDR